MLGAVRHKGFIPWDDDIDLCMMRPDFNRFVDALKVELNSSFEIKDDFFGLIKIGHSQTINLNGHWSDDYPLRSISIDIFSLDVVDDDTPAGFKALTALREVFVALYNYRHLENRYCNGGILFNDLDFLKEVYKISSIKDKIKFFWFYAANIFEQSSMVTNIDDILNNNGKFFRKEWFDETIYLPFETIELPAPIGYDEILTAYYGDWRTPVIDGQNRMGSIYSADIPWREFLASVDVKKFLPK